MRIIATLALIIAISGFILGISFFPKAHAQGNAEVTQTDEYHIQRALQFALEVAEFGDKTTWENPATDSNGYVIPTKIAPSPTGDFCKEYLRTIISNGVATTHAGGACRFPNGGWQTGPETLVSTVRVPGVAPAPPPTVDTAVAGSTPPTTNLQDQESVLFVQQRLNALGYDSGTPDGVMGSKTKKAIASYQVDNGLTVDGKITDALLASLGQPAGSTALDLPEGNMPVVLTIDGWSPGSEVIGGANDRVTSYLQSGFNDGSWPFVARWEHVPWSGQILDTEETVKDAKNYVRLVSTIAKNDGRPFVIVAHSWGSVLAYRAISELRAEGQLKEGDVSLLVTMGSPVKAQELKYRVTSSLYDRYDKSDGSLAVSGVVGGWINYWIRLDDISGPLNDPNIEDIKLGSLNIVPFKAHKAYFERRDLVQNIGQTIVSTLLASSLIAPKPTLISDKLIGTWRGANSDHLIAFFEDQRFWDRDRCNNVPASVSSYELLGNDLLTIDRSGNKTTLQFTIKGSDITLKNIATGESGIYTKHNPEEHKIPSSIEMGEYNDAFAICKDSVYFYSSKLFDFGGRYFHLQLGHPNSKGDILATMFDADKGPLSAALVSVEKKSILIPQFGGGVGGSLQPSIPVKWSPDERIAVVPTVSEVAEHLWILAPYTQQTDTHALRVTLPNVEVNECEWQRYNLESIDWGDWSSDQTFLLHLNIERNPWEQSCPNEIEPRTVPVRVSVSGKAVVETGPITDDLVAVSQEDPATETSIESSAEIRAQEASSVIPVHECDNLAAYPYDANKVAAGVIGGADIFMRTDDIDKDAAISRCHQALVDYPKTARFEFQLGRAYSWSPIDEVKSHQYLSLAAHINYAAAFSFIAERLMRSREGNCQKVLAWLERGYEAGDIRSIYVLGLLHINRNPMKFRPNGQRFCFPRNEKTAYRFFKEAADLGFGSAIFELALSFDVPEHKFIAASAYEKGSNNLPNSLVSALRWYRRAADLGHAGARKRLSELQTTLDSYNSEDTIESQYSKLLGIWNDLGTNDTLEFYDTETLEYYDARSYDGTPETITMIYKLLRTGIIKVDYSYGGISASSVCKFYFIEGDKWKNILFDKKDNCLFSEKDFQNRK